MKQQQLLIPLLLRSSSFPFAVIKRNHTKGANAMANTLANSVSIAGIKTAFWQRSDKAAIPEVFLIPHSFDLLINGSSLAFHGSPLSLNPRQRRAAWLSDTSPSSLGSSSRPNDPVSPPLVASSQHPPLRAGGDTLLPAGQIQGPPGLVSYWCKLELNQNDCSLQ